MKNKRQLTLLCLITIGLSFTACKDDDSPTSVSPITAQTNTELITEKNFTITDFSVVVDGVNAFSFADLDSCNKDDFTRFEKNGTATDNEGASKCDPSDPQTESYAWLFLDSESKLELDYGMGDKEVYNIVTNDGTTLKLDATEVEDFTGDGNDNTVIYNITFTKGSSLI